MSGRSDIAAVLAGCCLALVGGTIDAAAPAIAASETQSATAPQQLVNEYPLGPQRLCCGGQTGSPRQRGSTGHGSSRSSAGVAAASGRSEPLGKPARHGNSGGLSALPLIVFVVAAMLLGAGVAAIYRTRRTPKNGHRAEVGRADAGDAAGSRPSPGKPADVPEPGEAVGGLDVQLLVEERAALDEVPAAARRSADPGHDPATTNLGVLLEPQDAVDEDDAAYIRAVAHGLRPCRSISASCSRSKATWSLPRRRTVVRRSTVRPTSRTQLGLLSSIYADDDTRPMRVTLQPLTTPRAVATRSQERTRGVVRASGANVASPIFRALAQALAARPNLADRQMEHAAAHLAERRPAGGARVFLRLDQNRPDAQRTQRDRGSHLPHLRRNGPRCRPRLRRRASPRRRVNRHSQPSRSRICQAAIRALATTTLWPSTSRRTG
jgi:hypothetical protein